MIFPINLENKFGFCHCTSTNMGQFDNGNLVADISLGESNVFYDWTTFDRFGIFDANPVYFIGDN